MRLHKRAGKALPIGPTVTGHSVAPLPPQKTRAGSAYPRGCLDAGRLHTMYVRSGQSWTSSTNILSRDAVRLARVCISVRLTNSGQHCGFGRGEDVGSITRNRGNRDRGYERGVQGGRHCSKQE